jgi:hypothetical protein
MNENELIIGESYWKIELLDGDGNVSHEVYYHDEPTTITLEVLLSVYDAQCIHVTPVTCEYELCEN